MMNNWHIGDVRRRLFVPWNSKWNAWVRDITAWLERRGWFTIEPSKCRDYPNKAEESAMVDLCIWHNDKLIAGRSDLMDAANSTPKLKAFEEISEIAVQLARGAKSKGWIAACEEIQHECQLLITALKAEEQADGT